MLALKECLFAELKPAVGTSEVIASGEGCDSNFLAYDWLGKNHANRYMLNMHLRYYKGNTIQQTPGVISRITSSGNRDEPEVHTQ